MTEKQKELIKDNLWAYEANFDFVKSFIAAATEKFQSTYDRSGIFYILKRFYFFNTSPYYFCNQFINDS